MYRGCSHAALFLATCCNGAFAAPMWSEINGPSSSPPPTSLAALADQAARNLRSTGQRVACFESTSGGLIQASLLATPGASKITTCGAISYTSSRAVPVLGPEAQSLDEPLDNDGHRCRPKDGTEYIASKQERVMTLARQKRRETGATWCIVENGASGPSFAYDDLSAGFSAIFVSGPGVERGVLVRSAHANREENMWLFTRTALDLLADCVAEAEAAAAKAVDAPVSPPPAPVLAVVEDRYGGVEVSVREGAELETSQFVEELRAALEGWMADGKRGIWLKLPAECHRHISAAVTFGFAFHHATPEYLELTRWLPSTPSPLPRFAFTMIGVGGVVLNKDGKVLMVKERVSPSPRMQGAFKLPGGLADPGEDFAATVAREVFEECGIETELDGVVSLRHAHGRRFGQGDIYVLVRLRAKSDVITLDTNELAEAKWMSFAEVEAIRERPEDKGKSLDGKVSVGNFEFIDTALSGRLIEGVSIPNSKGEPTMMYRAPRDSD